MPISKERQEHIRAVREQYNLLSDAEAEYLLRLAEQGNGHITEYVDQVVRERVAPYNTAEYKEMHGLEPEGPNTSGSIGSAQSIGSEHSVAGIDPSNDPDANPLTTDLAEVADDGTTGQYETGSDGPVIEDGEVIPEEAVPEHEASKKRGRP